MTILVGVAVRLSEPLLFAARNLGAAGRRGQSSGGQIFIYLGAAVVVIALVCVGLYAATRWAKQRRRFNHATLFAGLCQAHGLDRRARGLLKQVANSRGVVPPARVFTEPRWLDPSDVRGDLRSHGSQMVALRERLFGVTAE